MTPIDFRCDSCKAPLKAPEHLAGKQIRCPKCSQQITIPRPAVEPSVVTAFQDTEPIPVVRPVKRAAAPPVIPSDDPEWKLCPYCSETILESARKCKHCGEFVDPTGSAKGSTKHRRVESDRAERARRAHRRNTLILLGVVVFAGMLLTVGAIAFSKGWLTPASKRQAEAPKNFVGEPVGQDNPGPGFDPNDIKKQRDEMFAPPKEADLAAQPKHIQQAMRATVLIELTEGGLGSGVVLQSDGKRALIVTNRHVVDPLFALSHATKGNALDTLPKVIVHYVTGANKQGTPVWLAPDNVDLALVESEVPSAGVQEAPWRTMPAVTTSEEVFAIGSPFGLSWTYTKGSVSSVRTKSIGPRQIQEIQTDTPINPGNSGGGLYNSKGQLVGINTSILNVPNGKLGFAIRTTVLQELRPPMLKLADNAKTSP